MQVGLLLVIFGIAGRISALPSGLAEVCAKSPCGRGANCQIESNLVSCNCPAGLTGDPFVECSRMQEADTQHGVMTQTSSSTMPKIPIIQNMQTTAEVPSTSRLSNAGQGQASTSAFTVDFQVSTDDISRVPIRGSDMMSTAPVTMPQSSTASSMFSANSNNNNNQYYTSVMTMVPASLQGNTMGSHYHHMNDEIRRPIASVSSGYPSHVQGSNHQIRPQQTGTFESPPHHNQNQYQHVAADSSLNNFANDPMGKYSNCRTINGIVVCADNSVDDTQVDAAGGTFGNHLAGVGGNNNYHQSNSNTHNFHQFGTFGSSQPPKNYMDRNQQPTREQNFASYPHSSMSNGQQSFNHKTMSGSGNQHVDQPYRDNNNNNLSPNNNDFCKSMCGINSICRLVLDRPVCGCPEGHTGDPSVRCDPIENGSNSSKSSTCQRHTECDKSQICIKSQCVDPCDKNASSPKDEFHNGNMCGSNAKCMVVEHTPLCGCLEGFYGNPYVACVA